jgi:hypothetical protein
MRTLIVIAAALTLGFALSCLVGGTTVFSSRVVIEDASGSPPTCATATGAGDLCVEGDAEANGALDVAGGATITGAVSVLDSSGDGRYWQEFHVDASKAQPGAAGATLTVVNTATLVWLLDATTEYLYFGADVHDEWDGASDVIVEASVAPDAAETADDIIEAEVVCEYYADHEDMDTDEKTQTRTVNHDIGSATAAGTVHELIFVLDYDLADNVIEAEDILNCRFRLDGQTNINSVWFLSANIKYRTASPAIEIGTFPSEG